MRTTFTERMGIEHQIVGFKRSSAVVAAVTNAGVQFVRQLLTTWVNR